MARVLIALYLIAQLVRPQDWWEPIMGFPTGYVITLAMFVLGLFTMLGDRSRYAMPQNWLLPLYVLVILMATWHGTDAARGFEQANIFLKRVMVFFGIVWLANTPGRIRFTLWTYLVLMAFLAYQAWLQADTGFAWGGATLMPGYVEIRVRWHGDWDGPNVFAILFIIAIAIALEMIFGPHGMSARVMASIVTGLGLMAIFYTNSRGAVLAVLGMVAYYFKDRFSKPVAVTLAVVAVGGLMALGPSRMSEVNSKEASAHERTWLWEQGLVLLRENPFFGIGRGMFASRVDLGLIAHNNYVQNFAELGLPGFFIFLSLLWFCMKAGWILSHQPQPERAWGRAMGRIIQGAVVGYALATFFVVMELDILYFLMGLCMAIYQTCRHAWPDLPRLVMGRVDVAIVGGGMTALIAAIWLVAVKGII